MERRAGKLVIPALYALAFAAAFVLSTTASRELADVHVIGIAGGFTAIVVAIATGNRLRALGAASLRDRLLLAACGVTLVAGVPLAVLLARYSDAPSGADSLFLTSSMWAFVGVAIAAAIGRVRPPAAPLAAALLLAVAGAAIVANWERPSSFNVGFKFIAEDLVLLGAGIAAAVAILVVDRVLRRVDPATAAWTLAVAGGVTAVAVMVVADPAGSVATLTSYDKIVFVLPYALALAVLTGLLPVLLAEHGPVRAFALQGIAPVLVTALTLVEGAVGMLGPRPMVLVPMAGGLAAALAAALGLWLVGGREMPAEEAPRSAVVNALLAGAFLPLLPAAVGLALPALQSAITGTAGDGRVFDATVVLAGWESVGGWLALSAAVLLAAGAWRLASGTAKSALPLLAAALVAVFAWSLAGQTPLHTWLPGVPPEVLGDIGSEYASMHWVAEPAHAQELAVVLAAIGAVSAIVIASWRLVTSEVRR